MTECTGQNCECTCNSSGNQTEFKKPAVGEQTQGRLDVFRLEDLDCADCAAKLEARLANLPGVKSININFGAAKMNVVHTTGVDKIINAVKEAGYGARLAGRKAPLEDKPAWQNGKIMSTVLSGLFLLTGFIIWLAGRDETIANGLFMLAILTGGFYVVRNAYNSAKVRSLDMNVLMSTAIVGAIAIGEFTEGATAMFLFSLGNTLQAYSMERSRNSIRELMELSPPQALVKRGAAEMMLPVEEIRAGDLMIVKPGERIAMDGKVLHGTSRVNQAPITGESMPVFKNPGTEVFAGTLNEDGALEIEVTRLVRDTTLARIVEMVEEAQAQRAPSQQFVDNFARYYTPAVIAAAVAVATLPSLFWGLPFTEWFERALILLVIACPCALVISTPVAIVSAIGSAARRGVLIKGGLFLEQAGAVQAIAFDKTGTLTEGRPEVTDIVPAAGFTGPEVLQIAAAVESRSQHPLGRAVVRHAEKMGHQLPPGINLQASPGEGARAEIEGQIYFIGNAGFFTNQGLSVADTEDTVSRLQQEGKTTMLVGSAERIMGVIAVADRVRPGSKNTLQGLKSAGIRNTIMLTGDNINTARAIAGRVGIDEFKAGLLPGDKMSMIKELQAKYGKVAMVGDGINDAPALAAADIGIAMGKAGTDTALETADIALMSDDLSKLPYAIKLSRQAVQIIKQNIAFSLLIKLVFILGTFWGITNLWLAVFADTGASLLVIANGMRLIAVKDNPAKG